MVILPPVLGRRLVLFVADLLHPVDDLAVEVFLDCDVSHGGGRRRAMPVLLARRAPDDVARSNHFDRTTPALHEPVAGRDDQGLTSGWVCHAVRAHGSNVTLAPRVRAGSGASNSGSMRTLPVKYSPGPFPDGWEPLCLMSIVFLSPTSLDVPSAPKSEDSGDHACRLYRQKWIAWLDELTNTPGRAHRSRRVRRSGGRPELHEGGDQARCQQVRDQPLDAHARGAPGTEASRTNHALGGAHGRGRAPTGATPSRAPRHPDRAR